MRLVVLPPAEPPAKKWIDINKKLEEKMVAYDNDRYKTLDILGAIVATLRC